MSNDYTENLEKLLEEKQDEKESLRVVKEDNPFLDYPDSNKGWTPIDYTRLKCDNIMDGQKWLQLMKQRSKTGLRINLSKSGTERHDIGIDRIIYLIKSSPLLSKYELNCSQNIHLDKILYTLDEMRRFNQLDNPKKLLYRLDLYVFQYRAATEEELKTGNYPRRIVHYNKRIIEVDGGYHDKWKQMAKDGWRDKDTQYIIPDVKIIRFKVDELVPESMNPNNDFASIDYDIIRKVLTGKDYFSTSDKIDETGRERRKNSNIEGDTG